MYDKTAKVVMLKGEDAVSISDIEKKSTSGLTDTYEITLTDGTKRTFNVSNGKGIKSIAKTSTSGLIDTYTTTYNDGSTSTFTVKNGEKGDTGSIENLKIGGVNLLNESTLLKAPSNNANWKLVIQNSANYKFVSEGMKVITSKLGNQNNGVYIYFLNANSIVKAGEKVTFSVDLKGNNIALDLAYMYRGDKNNIWDNIIKSGTNINKDKIDDFTRYSFSFAMPDVGTKDNGLGILFRQGMVKDNCEIIYKNAKLEREETPTDWTPSLEDIENTYATKSDVTTNTNDISNLANRVNAMNNVSSINTVANMLSAGTSASLGSNYQKTIYNIVVHNVEEPSSILFTLFGASISTDESSFDIVNPAGGESLNGMCDVRITMSDGVPSAQLVRVFDMSGRDNTNSYRMSIYSIQIG